MLLGPFLIMAVTLIAVDFAAPLSQPGRSNDCRLRLPAVFRDLAGQRWRAIVAYVVSPH
jgi:hypothetical protein